MKKLECESKQINFIFYQLVFRITADQSQASAMKRSEADVIAAENEAKSIQVQAETEAATSSALKLKRAHDLNVYKTQGSKIYKPLLYLTSLLLHFN